MGSVHVECLFGGEEVISLLHLLLLVDLSHRVHLIDALIENNHGLILTVLQLIQLPRQHPTQVAPNDNQVIFLQILTGWLTLIE